MRKLIGKKLAVILLACLTAGILPSAVYAMALPVRYSSKTASLTIRKKKYYGTTCYVAHMKLKKDGFRRFRGGVSKKKKGETTKNFARRVKAVFALSGDYSMPNGYTCIRGGKIYQGGNVGAHAVYNANTGMLSGPDAITLNGRTARQVVASGDVYNSFNFGPAIVRDGNVMPKKAMNQRNGKGRPRAFIGTTGKAGDLYVVVTEGADSTGGCRSDGKSYGLTGYQCAMVLKRLGCTFGVPIDGGGSVQMVYKGKAVNRMNRISFTQEGRPKTRKLYDFYYLSRTA